MNDTPHRLCQQATHAAAAAALHAALASESARWDADAERYAIVAAEHALAAQQAALDCLRHVLAGHIADAADATLAAESERNTAKGAQQLAICCVAGCSPQELGPQPSKLMDLAKSLTRARSASIAYISREDQ